MDTFEMEPNGDLVDYDAMTAGPGHDPPVGDAEAPLEADRERERPVLEVDDPAHNEEDEEL